MRGLPPSIDIERIRVSAELRAYGRLERQEPRAQRTHLAQDGSVKRRELLANALLLTATMAPEAHAAASLAMTALGVKDEIELFQSRGYGIDTVRLVLYGAPIGVEFMGGYLGTLDHGGLLAVLGHEIGHCIAHCRNDKFAWALSTSQQANTANKRAYAMAAEFTADRFGLIACRDLEAVLRLEMRATGGPSMANIRFDTDSYLQQSRLVAEAIMAGGGLVSGSTHPEHYVRSYRVAIQ